VSDRAPAELLAAEIKRLEEIARELDAENIPTERLRDLADEALEIAQRVSDVVATMSAGPADAP
jgi:hypothetical protein